MPSGPISSGKKHLHLQWKEGMILEPDLFDIKG